MAWLTKPELSGAPIAQVRDEQGRVVFTQANVNDTFLEYYTVLYQQVDVVPLMDKGTLTVVAPECTEELNQL